MNNSFLIKILSLMIILSMITSNSKIVLNQDNASNNNVNINMEVGNDGLAGLSFDTSTTFTLASSRYDPLVYEGLVIPDWSQVGQFKGVLAESWTQSPNGTIYTFNLRHNIHFSDGTPFNAYVMKYSIDRAIILNDPDSHYIDRYILGATDFISMTDMNITQANNYLKAGGVTALDEFTLQIKINEPFQAFLNFLSWYPKALSPRAMIDHRPDNYTTNQSDDFWGMISLQTEFPNLHDWTKLGLTQNHDPAISGIVPQSDWYSISYNDWPGTHAVGTGPYILTSFTPDDEITFSKNTNWWGSFASSSPDKISIKVVPDEETRKSDFLQGKTDIGIFSLDPSTNIVDSNGNSIVNGVNSYIKKHFIDQNIFFNMNDNLTKYITPAVDINSTWNITHIKDNNLTRNSNNNSILASVDNPFTALKFREAFSYAFDYNLFIQEYCPLSQCVREQGVLPKDMFGHQDDMLIKKILPSLNYNISKKLFEQVGWRGNISFLNSANNPPRTYAVNILKNELESMNVGINITLVETNAKLSENPLFQIGWSSDFGDPYSMLWNHFDSQGFFSQFLNYTNSDMDQLINKSRYETDPNKILNLYKQIEYKGASDFPFVYLDNLNEIIVTRDWLSNIKESGSLSPYIQGYQFQYVSKIVTITNSSSITTSSSSSKTNTPGFEFYSVIVFITMYFIKRKKQIRKD